MGESGREKREYGRAYPVAKAILSPIFKVLWKVKVNGAEHIPASGPAIFCPNHTSVIDSFMLPLVLPRRISYVGKAEYMDSWKTKYVFPAMGMIPIDRGGGEAAERALSTAARVLDDGEFFGIYPEGTRARDGKLHRGRTGAARLALRTGAPIIPVGMKGTREIQPPDAKVPKPFKSCEIRFGRPIEVSRYLDRADDRLVSRQIIDEVMYEIRELTGQEYIDEYASKKAEGIPAAETAHVVELKPTGTDGNGAAPRRSSADVLQPRS